MTSCEEICVSGIAGRFPECENVNEFWKALLEGADLITMDDRRFPPGFFGTPERFGKIPHPEHFDALYFGLPPKITNFIDPRQRVLLEVTYECLVDAGYNPKELRGSNTGVYVGMSNYAEDEDLKKKNAEGYFVSGVCLAMCANRISYAFDFKGTSYSCDTACSAGFYAFSQAVNDLKTGKVDNALVGGTHLLFSPYESSEFRKLQVLSPEGHSRPFSSKRNGYVRSEAVAAVFLQRKSNCRRIYATVVGTDTNSDGFKKEGISFPSCEGQFNLITRVFRDNKLDPNDVTFLEGHGTSTIVGDEVECRALAKFFGQHRKNPLLLGSVKSNTGHTEMVSGLCSLIKVLGILKTGVIPRNINTEPIDENLDGIKDGKIIVVTKNTPFKQGLVSISCMGFGGANAHAVVKSQPINVNNNVKRPNHRLVLVSGRTVEAVNYFIDEVQKNQDDQELLALVDEIHKMNIDGHNHRGFVTLGEHPIKGIAKYSNTRPIWFLYTGMGCQWISMGKDLMKIEVFKKTFDRCAMALKPYDIDLHHIVTTDDKQIFDDITNCFVGISSIQISLTDVLHHFGIYPDAFAGHSGGEVACAYADGSLTPEQAILIAYTRGYAFRQVKGKMIKGAMAAIGLSKDEVVGKLPQGIYIACQNSPTSVTISGPEETTKTFVEKLQSEGIFARLVNAGNIAFHTKYVHEAGKYFLELLKDVIKEPQLRSPKWISTSLRPEQELEKWGRYNTPEYHYNNLCVPVLFEQVFDHIPDSAIVIEMGPHGLLQPILKKALPESVTNISLLSRESKNSEQLLLSNIGRLYLAGCQPQLRKFYPEVQFPVSNKAASLSPLVKWDHSTSWFVQKIKPKESFGEFVDIDIGTSQWSYLEGHEIDGRILMPGGSYAFLVWQVFAKMMLKPIEEVPVVIEKLLFHKPTILVPNEETKFYINILTKTGNFEIFESGSLVGTGNIRLLESFESEFEYGEDRFECDMIEGKDFYKQCKLMRYNFKNFFKGIIKFDLNNSEGSVQWHGKFDCFLDSMMQFKNLNYFGSKDVMFGSFIDRFVIDPRLFMQVIAVQTEIPVAFNKQLDIVKCEGIEICRMEMSKSIAKQRIQKNLQLEIQHFLHYDNSRILKGSFRKSLTAALEIVLQNSPGIPRYLRICEVIPEDSSSELSDTIKDILAKKPIVVAEFTKKLVEEIDQKFDVLLITNCSILDNFTLSDFLAKDGFVIYLNTKPLPYHKSEINDIFYSETDCGKLYLLRKITETSETYGVVEVDNANFSWIDEAKKYINDDICKTVYLLSRDYDTSGLTGLANALNKEPLSCKFSVIVSDEEFDLDTDLYQNQLKKKLVFNILKNKKWGTYVHLPLEGSDEQEVSNATLDIKIVGNLASLEWVQSPPTFFESQEHNEVVHVFYSGLNFKDILLSTGKLTCYNNDEPPTAPSTYLGLEFSGLVGNKRVMGIDSYGCISLQHKASKGLIWEIPDQFSLEDAATIPAAYSMSYYALIVIGHLEENESVLIHAGAGATGIAAISIALSLNCEVFTTVSTPEKKEFLKLLFPQLKEENFGNSRNKSFGRLIQKRTNGRGVDIVLNSLSEELFEASVRSLAVAGRFLEIGNTQILSKTFLNPYLFLRGCSFHAIIFDNIFSRSSTRIIQNLMKKGIDSGVVKPLPRTVFLETQVEESFSYLASGKSTGKVIIQIRNEKTHFLRNPLRTIAAKPKIFFAPHKSYVITGGLGEVGLELAEWLMRKGARNIILNSRSGITNGYQKLCLMKWKRFEGVRVTISKKDSSNIQDAYALLSEAEKLAPIGGLFNLTMVLRDKLFINQTEEDFKEVFRAKWNSVDNLDKVTRQMCADIDHFVVFSTMSCAVGNPGQTNYCMANSALERLCEKRKLQGFPALAVQYGAIGEVGRMEDSEHKDIWQQFVESLLISSCFYSLEKFMLQSCPVGACFVLINNETKSEFNKERTPAEIIGHILGINDLSNVDTTLTMVQFGMDSLMSAEIKQALQRVYDSDIDIKQIQELTFGNLLELENLKVKPEKVKPSEERKTTSTTFLVPNNTVIKMKIGNNKNKIFVFHSIEGHVDETIKLAERLNGDVYGLQCTAELKFERIEDFAMYYVKVIREIQLEGPYFLLGNSYGSYLCLETASLLEKADQIVRIISINGSPAYCRSALTRYLIDNEKPLKARHQQILSNFSLRFPNVKKDQVENTLSQLDTTEEQTKKVCQLLNEVTEIEISKLETSVQLLKARLKAESSYKPEYILKAHVLLLRTDNNEYKLTEQYGLEQLCSKVDVIKLPEDHILLQKVEHVDKIADEINKYIIVANEEFDKNTA